MSEPVNFRGSNRLPELLAERERQVAILRKAEAVKRQVESEIRELLDGAESAIVDGWTVEDRTVVVPAGRNRVLRARRLEPVEKPADGQEDANRQGRTPTAGRPRKRRPRKRITAIPDL
jgi:hypothetical protein